MDFDFTAAFMTDKSNAADLWAVTLSTIVLSWKFLTIFQESDIVCYNGSAVKSHIK